MKVDSVYIHMYVACVSVWLFNNYYYEADILPEAWNLNGNNLGMYSQIQTLYIHDIVYILTSHIAQQSKFLFHIAQLSILTN